MARRKRKNTRFDLGTCLESIDYHRDEIRKRVDQMEKNGVNGTLLEDIDYGLHHIEKAEDKIEKRG